MDPCHRTKFAANWFIGDSRQIRSILVKWVKCHISWLFIYNFFSSP